MGESAVKILVIDDDPEIRQLLRNCFELEGYEVLEADSSTEVDACITNNNIDLITLDLNLGGENGLTIASNLRSKCNIPIIIVTGKGDVIDKVVGLEVGADDYISKPFHLREVIARVRSVLRRSSDTQIAPGNEQIAPAKITEPDQFRFNGWTADLSAFELSNPDGENCKLTSADFKLLAIFLTNPKRVLSRDQIMDHLNGQDWAPYDRTIDNQIARLRKKIENNPANPQIIKTIRGVGYTFTADVETL